MVGPLGFVLSTIVSAAEFEVPESVVTVTETSPAARPPGTMNDTALVELAFTLAAKPPTVTVGEFGST